MKIYFSFVCCLLFSMALNVAAEEQAPVHINLPDYYPKVMENRGLIEQIYISNGASVRINGNLYEIDSGASIHYLTQKYGTIQGLKVGMGVTFKSADINGKARISELWVLPEELTPPQS